jgi:PEP-CTERM motif
MKTSKSNPAKQLHDAFPRISVSTLGELVRRDLLHIDGNEWRFGDESNGMTRRFNDRKWKRADNSGDEWHKLIGLGDVVRNDYRKVFLPLEGSKDALAAAEIANRSGTLSQTGIISALGSGYRPIRAELEQLRGRWVGVIGDNDAPGIETTQLVSFALSVTENGPQPNIGTGAIGEYNAITGATVNASLVSGLSNPLGIAVFGGNLFVSQYGPNTIGEYNAITGATVNASLVSGLNGPYGIDVVPEPSTWAAGLLTAGALLCSTWRRRAGWLRRSLSGNAR